MKKTLMILLSFIFVFTAAAPPTAAQAQAPALLYLMHGINGLDVGQVQMQFPLDVSITGLGCVKSGLMFQGYDGPFLVGPGWFAISYSPANLAAPCSNAPVLWGSWYAQDGGAYVALAHLNPAGRTVSLYGYDLSHRTSDNGKARFTLVNGAAQPSIDFYLKGRRGRAQRAILGIANGAGVTFQQKAGRYQFQFNPTGSATPLFGPIALRPAKFHHYFMALVGSPFNGFFTASFSVNTYPFDPRPYNPFPWP